MTHETQYWPEAEGGPEEEHTLPDAETVPVAEGPDELDPVEWPNIWDKS